MDPSQEFPDGQSGPEAVDDRPLIDRIGDKNWKTRLNAYEDLKREIKATLGADPLFNEYASWVPKMCADANAGALDAGIDTALTFADMAPAGSDGMCSILRPYYDKIFGNVVEKAFGARASTQQKGKALLMKIMEIDEPTPCALFLLSKLNDKKPKVPPTCLEIIREGITAFGARTFPIKELLASLGPVLNGSNGPARETALALMADVTRWIGKAPFNSLLESIRSAQKSEFEKLLSELEAQGLPAPVPTLYTRKLRPPPGSDLGTGGPASSAAAGAASSAAAGKAGSNNNDDREFVEETDLTKKLKGTDYASLLAEEKWAEQLRGLQTVLDAVGSTPKLKPGCELLYDILQTCKNFLRQGHLQLQVSSIKLVTALADGSRGHSDFTSLVRPLLQTVVQKSKEKRLVGEVATCLTTVLKHCLSSIDSILEDLTEAIANKKNPVHGRVGMLEFVASTLSGAGCPEKVGNDHLKALADSAVSCCEDSDPKVRETSVAVLAAIGLTAKSRGRVAIDAYKLITGLETSAPKVFKRIQQAQSDANNGGGSAQAASSSSVQAVSSPVKPPARTLGGAAPAKPAASSTSTSSTSASTTLKRPTSTTTSASSSAPKKPSTTSAAAAAAAEDDNVEDLALSFEDAFAALGEQLNVPGWDGPFQEAMAPAAKWQDKVDALATLGNQVVEAQAGGKLSAHLVMYLSNKTSGFKISNINILKAVISTACQAAKQACTANGGAKFNKAAAWELLKHFGDKLSDRKTTELVNELLTALSEAVSPAFVVKRMKVVLDKIKAPGAHQAYLEWLKGAVSEFGAMAFPVQFLGSFCQLEMDNKIATVRQAAIEVLGQMYNHIGPRLLSIAFSDDMKPQLKATLESEFAKVGYDPTAAGKASKSIDVAGAAGAGGGSSSGGIPRQDLVVVLDKSISTELNLVDGKTSWQNRKQAMETILQACERSGHYLECSKGTIELVKQLKARINDTQANLKPLAVAAIGHVVASVEPDMAPKLLRLVAGALLSGCADNKKGMRDATASALQVAVTMNKSNIVVSTESVAASAVVPCADGEPTMLAVLVSPMTEALANPVGRLELLAFGLQHMESFCKITGSAPQDPACTELCPALVLCMQDKTAAVRSFAEQWLGGLVARGAISRAALDKATRDLPPSTKRTLQPSVERMMLQAGTLKSVGSTATVSAAVSVPSDAAPTVASIQPSTAAVVRPSGLVKPSAPTAAASMMSPRKTLPTTGATAAAAQPARSLPQPLASSSITSSSDDSAFGSLKKTSKARRLEDFYKLNWPQPPTEPAEHELQALKATWEPLVSPELAAMIFKFHNVSPNSLSVNQDGLLPAINELITHFQVSSPHVTTALQHSDLVLRWCAYALSLRETSNGLLRILQLVSDVFAAMTSLNSGSCHDSEVAAILPSLIDKAGHKSERHKQAFKTTLAMAGEVVAPTKLNALYVQYGFASKNKKSRVVSLEEIQRVVEGAGIASLGKTGLKEIGALLDAKDNELSVRLAGLELCYTLYTALNCNGDIQKLIKLLSGGNDGLSERTASMVEESIRKKAKHAVPSVTTAAPTQLISARNVASASVAAIMPPAAPAPSAVVDSSMMDISTYDHYGSHAAVNPAAAATVSVDLDASSFNPFKLEMTPPRAAAISQTAHLVNNNAVARPTSLHLQLDDTPTNTAQSHSFINRAGSMHRESIADMGQGTWQDVPGQLSPMVVSSHAHSSGLNPLTGIFADIAAHIDKLLVAYPTQQLQSEDDPVHEHARDYIKIWNEVVSGTWSTATTTVDVAAQLASAPLLVGRLCKCIDAGFLAPPHAVVRPRANAPYQDLALDVSLLSVSLATLFAAVAKRPEWWTTMPLGTVHAVLAVCLENMVDDRLVGEASAVSEEVAGNIAKALNMVALRVAATVPRVQTLQCLLRILLQSTLVDVVGAGNVKQQAAAQPASRLLLHVLSLEQQSTQPVFSDAHTVSTLLTELHDSFTRHPMVIGSDSNGADDSAHRPFRGAKTILSELVRTHGASHILSVLRDRLCIPHSAFICKLTAKLGNLTWHESDEESHRTNSSTTANNGIVNAVDPELNAQLVRIMDEITSARDKMVPIHALHALTKAHPSLDVHAYLMRISSAFRRFVLDTMHRLDEQQSAEATFGTGAGYDIAVQGVSDLSIHGNENHYHHTTTTTTSSSVHDDSNTMNNANEALRIIEGLKNTKPASSSYVSSRASLAPNGANGTPLRSLSGSLSNRPMTPRAIIQDKVRGSLNTLTMSLDLPTLGDMPPSAVTAAPSEVANSADADLALSMRISRLRSIAQQPK